MAFSLAHTLFFLLLLLPTSAVAQITVGRSLSTTDNSSWLSPSGEFAFGFHQLSGSDFFLLSIWYDQIPDRTIVWYPNGGKIAPRGSKVDLTADRGLVLTSSQGEELWTSSDDQSLTGVVAYGVMNDTGNFVLEDSNFKKLWESFQYPSDTMLPTQIMERGGVLSSRQSETNFSKGRFQLRFLQEGNLVLNTINLPTVDPNDPYYKTGITAGDLNTSNSGKQLVFNASGYFYILRENEERITIEQRILSTENNLYFRVTLNFDGIFTLYSHPKTSAGNESWTPIWSVPDNICLDNPGESMTGVCGYNSVCKINPQNKRPKCKCATGYSLLDPNDPYGSCKPDFIQAGCKEDEINSQQALYYLEELSNTNFPFSDYNRLTTFTEENCKTSCLQDCMCAAAVFSILNTCWKKKLPLSNGRFTENDGGKVFIKVRKDNSTLLGPSFQNPVQKKKNQDRLILAGSVLLGCSLFVIFILIGAICYGFFYKEKVSKIDRNGSVWEMNLRCLTYKELLEATDGFKEELGRGAFGIVYKGALKMGSNVLHVAVKKLINSGAQEKEMEFKAEVEIIGKTHHKNLVRLIGFCDEGQQRLLVYELLSHGTLAGFLFGDLKPNWKQRIQIAFGIARGLLYLHEECSTQIIHCDIKPRNILLDEYYNARISDFGLAKLLMMDQSQTHTAIRGTKGYVAPEWFRNMPITAKVDVYSFGVMLLEIICCRRSVDMESGEEEKAILTDWAYDCFREGTLDVLVEYEREAMDDIEKVERFVKIAIWCIQEGPSLRPTMRKVTHMLEGVVDVPIPPCPSPFTTT
ncbi:G-type lectin S-receptor-like serine/threonine-protein kinase RLK1 [Corylus avellana]|uniref:G-type lectin S-receptor-like serine/threonine-protein kinase RLK1 n=1 Tax=Corylus avellana TaxID=13451 RepID=UPI00286B877F|nr:G-type lectin S-receptor-like serine/threonine-protein kinase RLK1 [Corylus avellana]